MLEDQLSFVHCKFLTSQKSFTMFESSENCRLDNRPCDFSTQVLSQGMSPLEYLKIHIQKYIECVVKDYKNCDGLATGLREKIVLRRNVHKKAHPVLNYRDQREHFD